MFVMNGPCKLAVGSLGDLGQFIHFASLRSDELLKVFFLYIFSYNSYMFQSISQKSFLLQEEKP